MIYRHVLVNICPQLRRANCRYFTKWFQGSSEYTSISEGLKSIYDNKLLPLEEKYLFHDFHGPKLNAPDFEAKPIVLLMGQYSTGKTTFIRFLIERDFPGMSIGPEPTTDKFIVLMKGEREQVIPGNALVVDSSRQFNQLSKFGNPFLKRFQCSLVPSPVLSGMTLIDTPGILSGEKQRVDRGYDFSGVLEWFAGRVDRIILLFDAHKLDISDEFKRSLKALHGHEDKIRILLNKADKINHQQLMRVYGALMWSLGKVFTTPEVSRVYVGSFWDNPLENDLNRKLFDDEKEDLFRDLRSLPEYAELRKLNDLSKRARLAKVHAYIIGALAKEMPRLFGRDAKKKELINNLPKIYEHLQWALKIAPGDFPDIKLMQDQLELHDFSKFELLDEELLKTVDDMLASDITRIMSLMPVQEEKFASTDTVTGGAFANIDDRESPFGFGRNEGVLAGHGDLEWIVAKSKPIYDDLFNSLEQVGGKLTRAAAKDELLKSKLPNSVLSRIWHLADVDRDGLLDADEFALAMHLIKVKVDGHDIPAELPSHLVPPSKRLSRRKASLTS
ncbi:EH domain-containing protein 1-like [Thrips palmi]|uniref:EH domain-containing protein 1-like n=1 Tax=Thrips palmi TaxID=161013 RepID=A0A6P9A8F5_THRPL|nr:EH domain-containing protein 1-like [Thrips palmi]